MGFGSPEVGAALDPYPTFSKGQRCLDWAWVFIAKAVLVLYQLSCYCEHNLRRWKERAMSAGDGQPDTHAAKAAPKRSPVPIVILVAVGLVIGGLAGYRLCRS